MYLLFQDLGLCFTAGFEKLLYLFDTETDFFVNEYFS